MKNVLSFQNEKIVPHFKTFSRKPLQSTGFLTDKIERFNFQLKKIESDCHKPYADRETLYAELTAVCDSMLHTCTQFEQLASDSAVIQAARSSFHKRTHPMLSKSYFINRCRTWPRGYYEDFELLEFLYKNSPLSDGIGYYLDKYFLASNLGIEIRYRLTKMLELIQSELSQRRAPKMLDLGCGSGRLVCELAPEIHTSGARCSCLDLDPAALNFVSDRLGYVGLSDTAELLTFNALRIIDSDTALKEFGMQDIICTLGYFDQLPDDFFVKLVRTLYRMLNPGGRSIFAVRNASFVRSNLYQWLVDWNAIHKRTRSDFDRLLQEANIPDSTVSVVQSDSGALLFYTITK